MSHTFDINPLSAVPSEASSRRDCEPRDPFLMHRSRGLSTELVSPPSCMGGTLRARRDVYGCTCTVASLLTRGIGFCCESFAFTCMIDRFDEPGASALTTMPSSVPLPLTPGVLG
jgi:hypothetical protein